jgi:phosphatidate cytidylyltransferase
MHLKRWLTALVALPIVIYVIGFGPSEVFCLVLCFVSVAGLAEFYRITASELPWLIRWADYLLAVLFFVLIYTGKFYSLLAVIALWAFVPMTLYMIRPSTLDNQMTVKLGSAILGPVYICLPLGMLMITYRYPQGKLWIFFLLTVIFASDTGAYYCGRLMGKHKLYEAISPGKTWEGAIGGLVVSIIAALWFMHILGLEKISIQIVALASALSLSGQVGDLVESMFKRSHGIKDSSKILPGHGGILDRIDGLLFAIPVFYVYLRFYVI